MSAKLYHQSWFKHANPTYEASYDISFEYYVEEIGLVKIKTKIPKALAEQLDALGKKALWEKIGNAKK